MQAHRKIDQDIAAEGKKSRFTGADHADSSTGNAATSPLYKEQDGTVVPAGRSVTGDAMDARNRRGQHESTTANVVADAATDRFQSIPN